MSRFDTMPRIQLGAAGPWVGVQGLGCMGMSEFYGTTDQREALATLERALELGVTVFDTADMYGLGANERFLAPFVQQNRGRVIIATKFGYTRSADNPNDWSIDNRPEYIRAAVERSLQRLGLDHIDLYYMHRRNSDVPLADSVGAMADLVAAGKIRWLGLSEVNADELRAAHSIHPIAALQSEWSVFTRRIESAVVPAAIDLGTTLVPYAPLGRGLLTGMKFAEQLADGDARRQFPRFASANREANIRLIEEMERLAATRGITVAQLALAWLYTQSQRMGVKAIPIPGTRRRERLEENVAAVSISLDQEAMAVLDPLADSVQGIAV